MPRGRKPKKYEFETNAKGCIICVSHKPQFIVRKKPGFVPKPKHLEVNINGRKVYLHRYMYEQAHGPIPPGYDVHHTCETISCVNVAHMEILTHAEHTRLTHKGKKRKNVAQLELNLTNDYDNVRNDDEQD